MALFSNATYHNSTSPFRPPPHHNPFCSRFKSSNKLHLQRSVYCFLAREWLWILALCVCKSERGWVLTWYKETCRTVCMLEWYKVHCLQWNGIGCVCYGTVINLLREESQKIYFSDSHVCMYIYMYVCTYVRTYVRTYVCMYLCMYVCISNAITG
jgi:hypothetical protein